MANVFKKFYEKFNKKDSSQQGLEIVKSTIKKSINIGEAVVNILEHTGIAGFKFHIPETEVVKFSSEITDHYTDINTPVQDHIALKPVTITLTGLVGDYFYSVNKIEDFVSLIPQTLTLIEAFMVKQAPIILQIKAKLEQIFKKNQKTVVKQKEKQKILVGQVEKSNFSAIDLFTLFQDLYKLKSAQTRAFFYFQALWRARVLFSVETTWQRFDNMVIVNLEPKRDNNADITDFTVTFKQINRTESKVEASSNRHFQQLSNPVDKGQTTGNNIDLTSKLYEPKPRLF